MKTSGRWGWGIAVGSLVVLLGGYFLFRPGPGQDSEPQLGELKVGYIRIAECAQLYVGLSRGYFKEEGLEVKLQQMAGGGVILPAVELGDLDVGFSNVISMVLRNVDRSPDDPKRLRSLVGGTFERPGFSNHALLVRHGEFTVPESVGAAGVRVAINTTRNIEHLMLLRYLDQIGVGGGNITIREVPFPQMLRALDVRDVDVVAVVEPFIEPALRTQKYDLLDRHYLRVSDDTPVATYVVTSDWAQRNRAKADAFARAFAKASAFIEDEPDNAKAIIGEYTGIGTADLAVMGLPAFLPDMPDTAVAALTKVATTYGLVGSQRAQ